MFLLKFETGDHDDIDHSFINYVLLINITTVYYNIKYIVNI